MFLPLLTTAASTASSTSDSLESTVDSSTPVIIQPATKQLNALQRWWSNIDWDQVFGVVIQKGLTLLLLCCLLYTSPSPRDA